MADPPVWARYASGSEVEHFAGFCERYLIQSVDRWDGEPLRLEPFQLDLMGEALAFDAAGLPVWRSVAIVMPRKNGKTQLLAAFALYRLLTSGGSPEVLLAASSDKQAGRLFDAAALFVRRHPELARLVRVRDHAGELRREDGRGVIYRMSSDPARLHGYNPQVVVLDEVAQWTTPTLERAFAALTSGGGARSAPQVFTITTAGEAAHRSTSILGRILDAGLAADDVTRVPGLAVCRLWDSQTLVWGYEAPTSDPSDVVAMKLANPASWITEEYLARQAANPELTRAEVLQLHGCVWAEGVDSWIPAEEWHACLDDGSSIPDGADVYVGVDVGLVHDSTAVAIAWRRPDDRIQVGVRVFASKADAVAHEHHPGGALDLEVVEDHIRGLADRFRVRELVYDPRFFERSAQTLSEGGILCAPVSQASGEMADTYQAWYSGVLEGRVAHDGDRVLESHVLSTTAVKTDRGWKVGKAKQSRRIDALVACAIAVRRCELGFGGPSVYEGRGLLEFA